VETALSWLEEVENKMHVQPIIYTRESIYNKYLQDARFKKYDFWIAKYSDNTPQVDGWRLWQMSERGRAHGYDGGSIDVNIFNGDYAAFLKYIGTIL
jgi:GH25 family lysozyme M1 (1,4-beta-N-acetylmuramidase)